MGVLKSGSILILLIGILVGFYQKYKSENTVIEVIKWASQNEIQLDRARLDGTKRPFKVEYNADEWNLLVKKLELTRYFNVLPDVKRFSFGFDADYARELVDYWRTKFDWQKQVNYLNKYPQFKIDLNGTSLHYVLYRTNGQLKNAKSYNILLVDGWPGSYFELYRMIDSLEADYKDVSFNIIAPSIPGYSFSTPLNKLVDTIDTAFLFDALMRYEFGDGCKYYVHGEDWGSFIATNLAQLFPGRVVGIHVTMPAVLGHEFSNLGSLFHYLIGGFVPSLYYTEREIALGMPAKYSVSSLLGVLFNEFGYCHLQMTKPDTVGHGLTDSPVGLLAYILEKYSSWTFDYEKEIVNKRDGNLNKFEKDDLLTIVTVYWMSNSITSSMRLYKATALQMASADKQAPRTKIAHSNVPHTVSVAVQLPANEIFVVPSRSVQNRYVNLKRYTILENAGHFAAFQMPKSVANDFVQFIQTTNA